MTTIVKRKFRVSRRMKVALWGSDKDPVHKRNYGPGQHGRIPLRKVSDFYKQNFAQRAFRTYYNISKKQFTGIFKKAYRASGNTNDNLITLLERRLSSVLYHSRLVPTIFSAKQLISHKHVTVNGEIVNIASYLLKENDVVAVRSRAKDIPFIKQAEENNHKEVPYYLSTDHDKKTVKLLNFPKFADVPYPVLMEPNLVTEYFSSKM